MSADDDATEPPTPALSPEAILEHLGDAVMALDAEWRVAYVNRQAEALLRRTRASLVGRDIWGEFPEAVGSTFQRQYEIARAEHRAVEFTEYFEPLGAWFDVRARPLGGGVAIHFRDVTARRQEASDLQQANATAQAARDEAEAASRAKSQFLATMSHELRTPLNAILGFTDLLELGIAGTVAPTQQAYLARVRASGRHLLGLIDEILDLAKVEAGQMSVRRDSEPLAPAARRAADLVLAQAEARGIALRVPTDDASREAERELDYVGDEGRVGQILLNLLSNAVKFTAPGGAVAASWGTARASDLPIALAATDREYVYVRIADSGIGIAAEELDRIFEPFVQLDGSHSREQGGTGLGLAISRKLARLMDGELTVESRPGAGSTFTLWLPGAPPREPRHATPGPRAEAGRLLLGCTEEVTCALVRRLRTDPQVPFARDAASTDLENHVQTFLADIFQQVAIIDDRTADRAHLIRDGSHIQHVIADLHGAQRARLGWTEAAMVREFELLSQEVERVARGTLAESALGPESEDLVPLLHAFLGQAARMSLDGFEAARRRRAAHGAVELS